MGEGFDLETIGGKPRIWILGDHGYDLGLIELLVIRVISDCLLIPVLY